MFSFIHKFFENRREKSAERDRLSKELLQRVSKTLSDYFDIDGSKDAIQKWLDDNRNLRSALSDVGKLKRSSSYAQLKERKKIFNDFFTQASEKVNAIIASEQKKRADSIQVSKMLNQWVSTQKRQKIRALKPKDLGRKLEKLVPHTEKSVRSYDDCPCCGKDGYKKELYSTEGEAFLVAEHRMKIIGFPLYVYPCPYGVGFHITKNPDSF